MTLTYAAVLSSLGASEPAVAELLANNQNAIDAANWPDFRDLPARQDRLVKYEYE